MLGKNPKASQKVSLLFEEEKVRKCYFLIAHKKTNAKTFPFTAKDRLGRDECAIPRGMISAYSETSDEGKDAETHFELLLEKDNYVLVLAFPLSGRQHQIRVHAACNGYPLLGDKLYNGDASVFMRFKDFTATEDDHDKMQIPRQALHAVALKLTYPQEDMTRFIAPLPLDLTQWIENTLHFNISDIENLIRERLKSF
jgi:23S rRNA-/tRNA-specific pseudouridylate synthase